MRPFLGDADLTVIITTDASDEMTHSYLGQMVEYSGGDYFFAKPCDLNLILTLLNDLAVEGGPVKERAGAAFPTIVTWPTSACPRSR